MTQRRVHLVRHGRPEINPAVPPEEWRLDPAGLTAIDALSASGRLPVAAVWYSSPEAKAVQTARRLTDGTVTVVEELREQVRRSAVWHEDFAGVVRRAFEEPDVPAADGWEPLAATRDRMLPVVRRLLERHRDDEVVLVGHGTAWTLLVSQLTGRPPDLAAWSRLAMPDVWTLDLP